MKTIVVTQAYCRAELLNHCLNSFYSRRRSDFEHWILIKGYPINQKENDEALVAVSEKYGCKYFFTSEENVGVHQGLNQFLAECPAVQDPGTALIIFEQDSIVERLSTGFDVALSETLTMSREYCPVICLWGRHIDEKYFNNKGLYDEGKRIVAGSTLLLTPSTLEVYSVAIYDLDFVRKIGGFNEPNPFYGYWEWFFAEQLLKYGCRLGFLTEYREAYEDISAMVDSEYNQFKFDAAHINPRYQGSFRDWLKEKHPHLL
jgi:hypothetical protein